MKKNIDHYKFQGKDDLVSNILYVKDIIKILTEEGEKRYDENSKEKQQLERNLNHYKDRLEILTKEWNTKILEAISKFKEKNQSGFHY